MVTRLVIFDLAHDRDRRRVRALLYRQGFVRLFANAMWSRGGDRDPAPLLRRVRGVVAGRPHRILLVELGAVQTRTARWLIGAGRKE